MAARIRDLRAASEQLLVAGDMNIAPADADVYDPAAFVGGTHVSAEERSRLEAMLDGAMVDAYRALHPDEVQYTWWDYRAGHFHKGLGLRIDLALVSEPLAARLTACGIDRDYRKGTKPSDHAPLLVEFA
jgi:exodeoxyribonuclease-3